MNDIPPLLLEGGYWHQQEELRRRYAERHVRPHWALWWQPGCGKTFPAIRFARALRLDGSTAPALYACPSSLTAQVAAEAARFWPGARIVRLRKGSDTIPVDFDIAVVGYELLVASPALVRGLMARRWSLLICDESHNLRNPGASRTVILLGPHGQPCIAHRADHCVFLTGTPLINHAGDIYSSVRRLGVHELAQPSPNGGRRVINPAEFHKLFVRWENKLINRRMVQVPVGSKNLAELYRIMVPDYASSLSLDQVAPHLPPQTVSQLLLPGVDVLPKLVANGAVPAELAAALFDLLQQADDGDEDAARDAWELISECAAALATYRRHIGEAKAPQVAQIACDRLEGGEPRACIFFHHRAVGEAVLDKLHKTDLPGAIFYGGVAAGVRQRALEEFNAGRLRALVLQLDSAGQGLNLQAARYSLIAEMPWTYAAFLQALQRTNRLGQTQRTQVDIATIEGSLDSAIVSIALRKAAEGEALTGAATVEIT